MERRKWFSAHTGETKTDGAEWPRPVAGFCAECNLSRRTPRLLLISMIDPLLDFSSGGIIYARKQSDTCCDVCSPKSQVRKLTLYNKCAKANAYTRTNTHTWHSQEMGPIHFVGCNRTNFGREPLLMSWSLMCKSSSPRAKLIRSPHNPAQVQSCSLLHYLSCPPNNIRRHTANKSTSKTEKTCKFVKQTR